MTIKSWIDNSYIIRVFFFFNDIRMIMNLQVRSTIQYWFSKWSRISRQTCKNIVIQFREYWFQNKPDCISERFCSVNISTSWPCILRLITLFLFFFSMIYSWTCRSIRYDSILVFKMTATKYPIISHKINMHLVSSLFLINKTLKRI